MYKIRINSQLKAIFLAIIGIFLINSVKVHGTESSDYKYPFQSRFESYIPDGSPRDDFVEKDERIFNRFVKYMEEKSTNKKSHEFKHLIKKEFEQMFKSGMVDKLELVFQYALGEVFNKVSPVFTIFDVYNLNLMSIYCDVEAEDLKSFLHQNKVCYIFCRGYGYNLDTDCDPITNCCHCKRFVPISLTQYELALEKMMCTKKVTDSDIKRFPVS